jgi:hypothetical protein
LAGGPAVRTANPLLSFRPQQECRSRWNCGPEIRSMPIEAYRPTSVSVADLVVIVVRL